MVQLAKCDLCWRGVESSEVYIHVKACVSSVAQLYRRYILVRKYAARIKEDINAMNHRKHCKCKEDLKIVVSNIKIQTNKKKTYVWDSTWFVLVKPSFYHVRSMSKNT